MTDKRSSPCWTRFLLTRAAAGAGLGLAAAVLIVASPSTGLLQLFVADAGLAAPGLIGLAFAALSAAAFLATSLAIGDGDGGGPGRPVRAPVPARVRRPPRPS
jgi:hypothetical protein